MLIPSVLPGSQQLAMLCLGEMLLSHDLSVRCFIDTEEHQQVTSQSHFDIVLCLWLPCLIYFEKAQSLSKTFK